MDIDGDHDVSNLQNGSAAVINSSLDTETNDKVLAVYWKRGRLGAAYYDTSTSQLHVMEDVVDIRPDFKILKNLLAFVDPTEVVCCRTVLQVFLTSLQSFLHKQSDENNDSLASTGAAHEPATSPAVNLRLLSGTRAELSMEACRHDVMSLRLSSEVADSSVEEHEVILSSLLDLTLESMVTSISLLVRHLEKYLPQVLLSHNAWTVLSIHQIRLDTVVFVDEDTRRALQVFSPLQHPSAFLRSRSKHREGLSLMALFGSCRSPDGMRRMRELLTTPTCDITVLNARLDAIAFFCLPHSQQVVKSLKQNVARVRNIAGILSKVCQTHASVANWQTLYSSIYNAILVGRVCSAHAASSNIFSTIGENITREVHEVAHFIDKVVDFEESSRKNKFSVRAGIDNNLDSKRGLYSQVPEVLLKVAELELKDLPDVIDQCSIVCITELGYLLCVPAWLNGSTSADADSSLYHLPDFQVKFIVNEHVYYKTPRCSELDRILGDLVAQMSRIESDIMILLTQFIRRRVPAILKAVSLIPDLDCLLAMADVARQNNMVRPRLIAEPRVDVINGRHPLQQMCVDRFVPNDTCIGPDTGLVKLITGPNASGKSVYLKQVALIVYMAHIGSYVPADSATIGLVDHIRTRIQTVESCSTQMSAFFIDLKQMQQCLYNSSPRSLLVIDEFGKGTTEIDGQALLVGCLDHFLTRGLNCPMLLVSTHFHQVPRLLQSLHTDLTLLTLQRMSYTIEGGELVCLHKVEDGEAGSSFALLAARAATSATTLTDHAIQRAFQFLNNPQQCLPNPELQISKNMMKEIRMMKQFFRLDTAPAPTNGC